ncbi:hypothetical protein SEA_PICKLES13_3 [Microbacterium phage Pickles13]|nr:hypothetical protein SEA_PICKLES13_3 [Microbacterium phage Pickles13]
MSAATSDALDAAVRAHIHDETGGDVVVGWALTAGIVESTLDGKTSWLTTRGLARYEVRGLLNEAVILVDGIGRE